MDNSKITRTDILNHLAEKHKLWRYLEIGVQDPAQNFDKIKCRHKFGVDPTSTDQRIKRTTSDNFFRELFERQEREIDTDASMFIVDLIFIDGLHTAEQVKKDFENALKVLSPNGFIVLHDCNPEKEEHTIVPRPTERGHWNGSCYKFAASLLHKGKFTVDIDNGCMVVPNKNYQILYEPLSIWTWDLFHKNRKHALNLISWEEFIEL